MYLVWVSGSEEEGSSTRGQQEQRWGRWKQVSAKVTALLALRLLILLIIRRENPRPKTTKRTVDTEMEKMRRSITLCRVPPNAGKDPDNETPK